MRILELGEPPYATERIHASRRRLAKQWHPDRATPDQRPVHTRHMVEVNRAADLLLERAAESGGSISAVHYHAAAQAARDQRREAGERAARAERDAPGSAESRRRRSSAPQRSDVHSYVRSRTHPEWGVGRIVGLFATGEGVHVRRWAEVAYAGQPVRTLRYENLAFVDFSRPDPGTDRARRFLAAARRATAKGDHPLAVQRLLHARSADPVNVTVFKALCAAQRAAGDPTAAVRTASQWARIRPDDAAPHRIVQEIYTAMGAHALAAEADSRATQREARRRPQVGRRRRRRSRSRQRTA